MINIKKNIETKVGSVEVYFTFEDGTWVGVTNGIGSAIASDEDFEKLENKLIKMYETLYVVDLIMKKNPHRGKVDKELLPKFFGGDWWKLHKN